MCDDTDRPSYARGGIITGPGGTTDDIPIQISSCGYIISAKQARKIAPHIIAALGFTTDDKDNANA